MADIMHLYRLDFSNGKKYIGITKNPKRRLVGHHTRTSGCTSVRSAIKKHGSPVLTVLCTGLKDYIADLEILAIEAFKTRDRKFGYNISLGGNISPSTIKEVAAKIGSAHRGRKLSLEIRGKISAGAKGRVISPEQRVKMSAAKKGRKLSFEHCAKMSAGLIGHTTSPETRAKISAAHKGRKQSPEQIAKLSAARKGRVLSAETRARISASMTAYRADTQKQGIQII